jgi:hypothetical protein
MTHPDSIADHESRKRIDAPDRESRRHARAMMHTPTLFIRKGNFIRVRAGRHAYQENLPA